MINALVLMLTVGQQADPMAIRLPELEVTARTVQQVADEIGEAAAIKLLVPGKLGKEVVFASLKNKSVKECMDSLATVAYGDWKFENGVYTLARNQSAQAAENKARSAELEILKKQLKDKATELKQPAWSKDSAQKYADGLYKLQKSMQNNFRVGEGERAQVTVYGMSLAGPAYDLLSTVIQGIDPIELANIPIGGRVVLSTNPNRMQKPLRMSIIQAIQQFTQRMDDVFEATKSSSYPDLGADFSGSIGFPKSKSGAVAKANIILYHGSDDYSIGIQLVGRGGEEIAAVSTNLGTEVEVDTNTPSTEKAPEPSADRIKLSPISSEFLSYVGAFGLSGGSARSIGTYIDGAVVYVSAGQAARNISPTPELNKVLLTPAQYDPLNLVIPESLKAVYQSKDYIGIIPDAVWDGLTPTQVTQLTQKRFKDILTSFCEVSDESNVLTIRPLKPFSSESNRLNRVAMERLISQVNGRGYARLSELAEYASTRSNSSYGQTIDMMIMGISIPFAAQDIFRGGFGFGYWLAPIIASQKQTVDKLTDGDLFLNYGRMNTQEKYAFERLIFDEAPQGQMSSGNVGISVNTQPDTRVPMARDSEPTELHPNGLPVDAGVKLSTKSQDGVLGKLSKSRNGRLMSATQLGAILGMIDGEGGSEGEFKITAYELYQIATVKDIQITVESGPPSNNTRSGPQFVDGEVKPGSPLTMNQLPSEMIARIQTARKQLSDMMQNMNSGRGGQRTPPPPIQ